MNRKSSGLASLQSGISAGLSAYAAGGPVKHFYGGDFVESLNQQISGAAPLLPYTSQYSSPSYSGSSIGLNPHLDEIMVTGARAGIPYTGYTGFAGIMGRGGLGGYSGQTNYYDVSGESLFLLPDGSIGTESEAQDAWAAAKGSTYEEKRENASRAAAEQPTGQTVQDYLGLTASEEAARRGGATLYLPQDQYERAQGLNARVERDIAAMTPEQRAAYQDAQVLSPSEALSAIRTYAAAHPDAVRAGGSALLGGVAAFLGVPLTALSGAANLLGVGRDKDTSALEGTPASNILSMFGIDTARTPTASEQRRISAEQNATNTPEIFVTGSRDFDTSDFMTMTNPFEFTTSFGSAIPGTEYLGDQTGAAEAATATTPEEVEVYGQLIRPDRFVPELNLPVTPVNVNLPTDGYGNVVGEVEVLGQRIPTEGFAPELNLPPTPPWTMDEPVTVPTEEVPTTPTEEDTTRIKDIPTITVPGSTPPIISEGGGPAGLGVFRPTGKKDWGTFTMPTLGPYRETPLVQTGTDTSSGMSFQTYAPNALDDYLARLKQFQRGPQTAGIGGVGYQALPGETENANPLISMKNIQKTPYEQLISMKNIQKMPYEQPPVYEPPVYEVPTLGPYLEMSPKALPDETKNVNYASGGIASLPEYRAGGKLLTGPGDGMSDSIPAVIKGEKPQRAALADGEFVIPADVVSHLGNGSTKAGADTLYAMMDRIRQARTGRKRQSPAIDASDFLPA